jgi:RHH-type transcriptional regulator, proline utilization regulon repressor / proline dehydrogenase / delta 1-pyrroline-5-carboxylate dehydrogenase
VKLGEFRNEPVLELRRASVREELLAALAELDARLPVEEQAARSKEPLVSFDPGRPDRAVAVVSRGTEADAREAIGAAVGAFPGWRDTPVGRRAEILVEAAALLRARRLELAALQVRECAKPWAEADADVCEAIDFLEYYARQAIELDRAPELLQVPGERNTMRYVARGVAAVIAPWNFPIAIPCGMTAAALAAGNAVVLKPAEQSPACGYALATALREAGVPPGAISLLPGFGDAGEALVRHPGVHTIAFTGSSAVGLAIVRAAAETPDEQRHVKRVVSEMGGKNCVIVDADADLDEVVPALTSSAFGYAGQKCSAAARVLVHERIADALLERLVGATATLVVGQAEAFGTDVPPVIERDARDRIERYADEAAGTARLERPRADVPVEGWFCAPAVAYDLPSDSPVLTEEIFGPLLAVERVSSVDDALDVLEQAPFALTAGVFSRSPAIVEQVKRRAPAGNLYVNRGITGAKVGRQPFGGNRRSGIGSKAGGPDYLLQFVEPRVVSENTTRHGLVVDG